MPNTVTAHRALLSGRVYPDRCEYRGMAVNNGHGDGRCTGLARNECGPALPHNAGIVCSCHDDFESHLCTYCSSFPTPTHIFLSSPSSSALPAAVLHEMPLRQAMMAPVYRHEALYLCGLWQPE